MGFLQTIRNAVKRRPSQREAWQRVCSETGAKFVEGGFGEGDKAILTDGASAIILDTYTTTTMTSTAGVATPVVVTYTRMQAPAADDGFEFQIHRKSIFTPFGKLLGMQDVEVGYPDFDEAFVIKADDEARVKRLLRNKRIRDLIAAQKTGSLRLRAHTLTFETSGSIREVERLKALFDLFAELLPALSQR